MNGPSSNEENIDRSVLNTSEIREVHYPATKQTQRVPLKIEDLALLDSYSQAFYHRLISVHPEWRSLAQRSATCDAVEPAFFLELPSPSPRIGTLWISTEQ